MLHRTNSFSCFQIVSLFRCTITHRFAKWYEITLLSNRVSPTVIRKKFYYLMKLHYSQTVGLPLVSPNLFYYLMKLHYSQTERSYDIFRLEFYYLMKLHYSQTERSYDIFRLEFYYWNCQEMCSRKIP